MDSLEASLLTVLDENRKNRHLLKSAYEYVKFTMNYKNLFNLYDLGI